ncbi:MAG: hypothetical protein R6X20_04885 [Phycisphaerae bacterium]
MTEIRKQRCEQIKKTTFRAPGEDEQQSAEVEPIPVPVIRRAVIQLEAAIERGDVPIDDQVLMGRCRLLYHALDRLLGFPGRADSPAAAGGE